MNEILQIIQTRQNALFRWHMLRAQVNKIADNRILHEGGRLEDKVRAIKYLSSANLVVRRLEAFRQGLEHREGEDREICEREWATMASDCCGDLKNFLDKLFAGEDFEVNLWVAEYMDY